MRCERARRLILDASLGLADRAAQRALLAHCSSCPACRAARVRARDLDLVLAQAASSPPSLPDLAPRIAQRVAGLAPPVPAAPAAHCVAWAACLAAAGGIAGLLVLAAAGPALVGLVEALPLVVGGLAVALRPVGALCQGLLNTLATLGVGLLPSATTVIRLFFWSLPLLGAALLAMLAMTSFVLGRDLLRGAPARRILP